MNKIIIKGRLTADTELKNTQNGVEYIQFSVAVDRYVKDGEKQTDFIPIKAYCQSAVFINKYFGKGSEILLEGNLRIDKYEKDGENRTFTYVLADRVEFCGSKNGASEDRPEAKSQKPQKPTENTENAENPLADNSDDDLPF